MKIYKFSLYKKILSILAFLFFFNYKAFAVERVEINDFTTDAPKLVKAVMQDIEKREPYTILVLKNEEIVMKNRYDLTYYEALERFNKISHIFDEKRISGLGNFVGYSISFIDYDPLTIKIDYSYYLNEEQEKMVNEKIEQVLSEILKPNMTELEKEKAIVKWICDNVEYDHTETLYTDYDALFKGKTVCNGYSVLTHKMLNKAGIKNYIITGLVSTSLHAWNLVNIDGSWYELDVTWMDVNEKDLDFTSLKGFAQMWFNIENSDRPIFTYIDELGLNKDKLTLRKIEKIPYIDNKNELIRYIMVKLAVGEKEIKWHSKNEIYKDILDLQIELANLGFITEGIDYKAEQKIIQNELIDENTQEVSFWGYLNVLKINNVIALGDLNKKEQDGQDKKAIVENKDDNILEIKNNDEGKEENIVKDDNVKKETNKNNNDYTLNNNVNNNIVKKVIGNKQTAKNKNLKSNNVKSNKNIKIKKQIQRKNNLVKNKRK